MALVPWRGKRNGRGGETQPLVALRSEMDRLFDTFLREPFGALDWPWATGDRWLPAIDISQDEKEVIVRAELPGLDPKDLDVSISGNELILKGEKKESTESKEKGYYHSETRYGAFERTVPLPEGVDSENVDAQYTNGVLTLRLKKTQPEAAKRIEVKVK